YMSPLNYLFQRDGDAGMKRLSRTVESRLSATTLAASNAIVCAINAINVARYRQGRVYPMLPFAHKRRWTSDVEISDRQRRTPDFGRKYVPVAVVMPEEKNDHRVFGSR
ncbi:hypothetical protein PQR37_41105, partial [Paraburkholderia nemoris]|uniref:hypothetical protein n=1 Tax=Paraburkholderia nemoris TaxID=2793076 RepID=UPI0038B824CF